MEIRKPAVCGQFYPSTMQEIKKLVASFKIPACEKKEAIGCILPHAGYIYSGKIACQTLSKVKIEKTCIILGPNHTGFGPQVSIMKSGTWQTPYENIDINSELAEKIIDNSKYAKSDTLAHAYEHSIEVLLPLISEFSGHKFDIVPIVLATDDKLVYKDIADSIIASVINSGKKITIIASSDMTHFETRDEAVKKDREAIKEILEFNDSGLFEKVKTRGISMCGYVPAAIATLTSKKLGAKKATLVSYGTSADTTKDNSSVVGYAGIIFQ